MPSRYCMVYGYNNHITNYSHWTNYMTIWEYIQDDGFNFLFTTTKKNSIILSQQFNNNNKNNS
ncbi:hypothetical protein DERF_008020 [Dermatophagoides farinae]|uniref:Uncharacterized protein n=1 Tax=Dermatophagoides farinae TaxID=6954 RepID=A0A922I1J6_DERFA|nr:hypothetical protein DERF_008020 [Dermatophagoides farinae]